MYTRKSVLKCDKDIVFNMYAHNSLFMFSGDQTNHLMSDEKSDKKCNS